MPAAARYGSQCARRGGGSGSWELRSNPRAAVWPGGHPSGARGPSARVPLPAGRQPEDIAVGPDGVLWFTGAGAARIGRMTTSGHLTEFLLATADDRLAAITAGPDKALRFTGPLAPVIGRPTTSGPPTEFRLPRRTSLRD